MTPGPAGTVGSFPWAWLRSCVAPLCGVGLALSFPEPGWPLLKLSLGLLFILVLSAPSAGRAAGEGLIAGFVFYSLLLRWFAAAILEYTTLGPWLALGAVVGAGAILAPGVAVVSWFSQRIRTRWGLAAGALSLATLWCGYELSRTVFPVPFPWAPLSAASAFSAEGNAITSVLGALGYSWLEAVLVAAFAAFFVSRKRSFLLAALVVACVFLGIAWLAPDREAARELTVAVAQGSLPRDASVLERFETYETLTRDAASRGARLVIWPESAVRSRVDLHPGYRLRLEGLASELGVDIMVSSITSSPSGGIYNSAVLVRAIGGVSTISPKRRLVPFGEYLPLRFLMGASSAIAAEAGDFEAGTTLVLHPSAEARIGALVCYEAVFPSLAREAAMAGADLLVTMTNDSWFGWSSGPRQHLAHSVLRSAETGLPLLRAANTGISVIVDGDGRLLGELGLGERGILVARVGLGRKAPSGLWLGGAVSWACAILSIVFAGLAFVPRRRTARAGEAQEDAG